MQNSLQKRKHRLSLTTIGDKLHQITLQYPALIQVLLISSSILVVLTLITFGNYYLEKTLLSPVINGDEAKYYDDLIHAVNSGLLNAIDSGASITFLTLSYLLNDFIDNPLLSIRITSLVFAILLFAGFILFAKNLLKTKLVWVQATLGLLYCLVIQMTMFIGYNDLVMHFFGLLFWILFINSENRKIRNSLLMGVLLALIAATRKMSLIYIVLFFGTYALQIIINKSNRKSLVQHLGIIAAIFIAIFLVLNFTSLKNGHGFSFDEKTLGGSVNWSQWEYHNAILIDKGLQERFHHIEIDRTKEYLLQNGQESLPSNFFEMITFDFTLTIKEFFIDTGIGIKYFIRQTGLWPFLFLIFFVFRSRSMRKRISSSDFLYIFSSICFLTICFIVLTNIQMRWFMFFIPIMFLLIAKDFEDTDPKYQKVFFTANNLLLVLMFVPLWIKILIT